MIYLPRLYLTLGFRMSQGLIFQCAKAIIVSFLSLQLAGCGAKKISQYHVENFNTYSNRAEQHDLHIAIQALINEKEQERYFGVVLTDVGILPVFIIAENHNDSNRFMLRDDHISLRNKVTNVFFPKPLLTDAADDTGLEGAKQTSLIAGNILGSSPLLFASYGLARNSEKVKSIQDAMFDKTLFTQTIFPGKSITGFAYFKIADTKINFSTANSIINNLELAIKVNDEGEQSICIFQFGL